MRSSCNGEEGKHHTVPRAHVPCTQNVRGCGTPLLAELGGLDDGRKSFAISDFVATCASDPDNV
jgi:hypothetical protein